MELRDYQVQLAESAATIIKDYGLAFLAMQVRTGKSLTALKTADIHGAESVLVLTKLKAIKSIEADYRALAPSYSIKVTNYEQAEKLNPNDYDFVIIDESQNFGKFPQPSKRMLVAKRICAGKPVIFLSGTPSPESYSQLFHQLAISSFSPYKYFEIDKKWGFRYAFYRWAKSGYVEIKKKKIRAGLEVDDYSKANGTLIWKDIKHLFLQFTQEEAGFEAKVDEQIIYVEMTDLVKKIAKELSNDKIYTYTLPGGLELVATVNSGAELINKLSQVYSGTLIYDDHENGVVIDVTKAIYIQSRFAGQKIAIFYKFKCELKVLQDFFPNWTDSPEAFNENTNLVFLGQVQSAREGVNLATADALVMYNIDFSATSYFQARARIQSKDRKGSAPMYWIFSAGGIEDKIYRAVSNKKNFTYSYYQDNYDRVNNKGQNKKAVEAVGLESGKAGGY